ncbi:MAG: hypothetical protein H7Y04_09700 [Verrucomicrobia bacterium]|nr:hypothetical protein [Cytophagales bacterium]
MEINSLKDKQLYEFSEVLQAEGYAERIFIFGNLRRRHGIIQVQSVLPQPYWYGRDSLAVASSYAAFFPPTLPFSVINIRAYQTAVFNLIEQNPEYEVLLPPIYEVEVTKFPILYKKVTVRVKTRMGKIKSIAGK